jgi:hypothetical protein
VTRASWAGKTVDVGYDQLADRSEGRHGTRAASS